MSKGENILISSICDMTNSESKIISRLTKSFHPQSHSLHWQMVGLRLEHAT